MPGINLTSILIAIAAFVGLVVIFIGVGMVMHSRKQRMQQNGVVYGNIGMGVLLIAFGVLCLGGMGVIYAFRDAITTYTTLK